MNTEDHLRGLKESLGHIQEAIERGLVENQRSVGFNTSAAAVDMLEIYFHKKALIDPGMVIKHDWFLSKSKVEEKIFFDFPKKQEIIELVMKIEAKRNILCYGKKQPEAVLIEVIEDFNKLKKVMKEAGLNEGI